MSLTPVCESDHSPPSMTRSRRSLYKIMYGQLYVSDTYINFVCSNAWSNLPVVVPISKASKVSTAFLVWFDSCYWQEGLSPSRMRVGPAHSVHDLIMQISTN